MTTTDWIFLCGLSVWIIATLIMYRLIWLVLRATVSESSLRVNKTKKKRDASEQIETGRIDIISR